MKALIRQFLGENHSWSVFGWGVAKALLQLDHQVDLFPTDGIKKIPEELKNNVIGYYLPQDNTIHGKAPNTAYDMQISYTAMKNFPNYLSCGFKNRFGMWCYEWAGKNALPNGFAKHHKSCDFLLTPSQFSKSIFIDSGIPEEKIKVIPHGIDSQQYNQTTTINLKTEKKFKILANIAQNHKRKNLPGLLQAYGQAFTKQDDVCLILKAKEKSIKYPFEISLQDTLNKFYKKFPQHAEIKIFSEFLPDISALYRSIDATYTMAHCEGFYFPGLEGLAAGKLAIAPRWGGQLDFLNDSNSLLIDGQETRADPSSMYWESKPTLWFQPNIDDAVKQLQTAYRDFEKINQTVSENCKNILMQYDWTNITREIIVLCK